MSVIALESVEKRFGGVQALAPTALAVESGELFAVLGPSGCGKTTLLRLIAGFERPDAGTIEIGGHTVAGRGLWVEPERRRVGLVFQDDALFPHLTVAGNVGFGVGDDGRSVSRSLALVGLDDRAGRYPGELSGGERQRVSLARALARAPDIVLLDEPFSSLDASLRGQLRREVARILREAGATAVLVTHDQEEALSLADRVAVMRDGQIVQVGAPPEIYWCPADRWTAGFVGDVNVVRGHVANGHVDTPLGRFPLSRRIDRDTADVAVRPENLALHPDDGGWGVVTWREFRGHDVLYEVRHEHAGQVLVQLPSVRLFDCGARVTVTPAGAVVAPV
jgi:iron(III) transport system ATP-binding protein